MDNLAEMKLQGIDSRAMANSKFVGFFVNQSHKEERATPLLNDDQARRVRRTAEKILKESLSHELYRSTEGTNVTGLRHTQIELGDCLGKGSFSEVYAIKAFHKLTPGQKLNPQKYVVKLLQSKYVRKPQELAKRAADLAKDGLILASLDHKNLLKVKGWTPTMLTAFESAGRHDSFFLVLEKLQITLDKRIEHWKQKSRNLHFTLLQRGSKKTSFWIERIEVALHLADAIQYFHDRRIIHRDLKPENVGFDSSEVLKLYDFDVARVMPEISLINPDATFQFTRNVGSARYMSPECGLGHEYNRKADVYSFSLLLYELLSLEKPYQNIKSYDHEHAVFQIGARPIIPEEWPSSIRDLLEAGWSQEAKSRPDMQSVYGILLSQAAMAESKSSESARNKNWGWSLMGKDPSSVPQSPSAERQSFSLKMGASTPILSKEKIMIDHKSLSKLDL
jgi:serine/threonine protein kinase